MISSLSVLLSAETRNYPGIPHTIHTHYTHYRHYTYHSSLSLVLKIRRLLGILVSRLWLLSLAMAHRRIENLSLYCAMPSDDRWLHKQVLGRHQTCTSRVTAQLSLSQLSSPGMWTLDWPWARCVS